MINSKLVVLGLASAMTLAVAAPSFAAPVLTSTAIVKDSAAPKSEQIRWRGRGGGVAAGAAAGFIAGAAIGSAAARPGYYAYDPYYAPGYAYAPAPVYESYGYETYGYQPAPRYRYQSPITQNCNSVTMGSSDSSNCY